ncbi:MAG: GHKL domain-containing protein [Candidatus Marinimicrobia bacterium]|nr:GHKL domain-containing protein [Candidatus Neomarinimicrobiota bacterium]
MSKIHINRWFILFYLFLFLLVIFWSYSEFRSRNQQILDGYREQARLTVNAISHSGIRQLDLSENLEQAYKNRAFSLLRTLDELDRQGMLNDDRLETLVAREGFFRIMFINAQGDIPVSAGHGPGPGYGMARSGDRPGSHAPPPGQVRAIYRYLEPILSGKTDSLLIGLPSIGAGFGPNRGEGSRSPNRPAPLSRFMAAIAAHNGGAWVAQLNVEVESALRAQADFQNLLDSFLDLKGVAYLRLTSPAGEPLVTLPDSLSKSLQQAAIESIDNGVLYVDAADAAYIQMQESVRFQNQPFHLIIGFYAEAFDMLKHKLLLQILFRTGVFIILAVVITAFFISRQNTALLQAEKERIESEVRRLERLQRIQEKQAAMGELAAGVAHEIRNPLNAIGILVQRLQKELKPADGAAAELKSLTSTLRNEVNRINTTLEEFLAFARPIPLKQEPVAVKKMFGEIKNLFGSQAESEQKTLTFSITGDPVILGDDHYLHQAMNNLVKNALEATTAGDTITLHAETQGEEVLIRISDTGAGIPAEAQNRLFDLFYSTKDSGNGIGLALVHKIINDHEGSIEVASKPHKATIFTIRLPAAQTQLGNV